MILSNCKKNCIYTEMDDRHRLFWFDRKHEKLLPAVDTLYYGVKLSITDDQDRENWKRFQRRLASEKQRARDLGEIASDVFPGMLCAYGGFAGIYGFHYSVPDAFDFFVAEYSPNSDTPEILVQLRSRLLWEKGPVQGFTDTLLDLSLALSKSEDGELDTLTALTIQSAFINRIDLCWHTNWFQDLDKFINPYTLTRDSVSKYEKGRTDFSIDDGEAKGKTVQFGRRSSNNCMIRFYNKTEEVISQGYKAWFLYLWQLEGLISRFDLYCLEKAYELKDEKAIDGARLSFYLENGKDDYIKAEILEVLKTGSSSDIKACADRITPRVTQIMNIEYEVKRKFLASIEFPNFQKREALSAGVLAVLDSRKLLCNYLTFNNFRIIDRSTASRAERCDVSPFWDRLRKCKLPDVPILPEDVELVRTRSETLDDSALRRRAVSSVASFGSRRGLYDPDISGDLVELFTTLNDNDLKAYERRKQRTSVTSQAVGIPAKEPDKDYLIINRSRVDVMRSAPIPSCLYDVLKKVGASNA